MRRFARLPGLMAAGATGRTGALNAYPRPPKRRRQSPLHSAQPR